MSTLFDDIIRTNEDIAKYQTSTYAFYNQTAREEFSRIRITLEEWYKGYPKQDISEFLGRFRSNINKHHWGALLELFVFRLFSSFNFNISRTDNLCDFLVAKSSQQFYLECTLAKDSLTDESVENQLSVIKDKIDELTVDFFINLSIDLVGEQTPKYSQLERFIKDKIKDETLKLINDELDKGKLLEWMYESNGWKIIVSFLPKRDRKSNSRNMGMSSIGMAKMISPERHLFEALNNKKPSRYRNFHDPYVIVVNPLDPCLHKDDIIQSLFKYRNLEYGFYGNSSNPKNTSVSGVLLIKRLSTTSIFDPKIEFWPNPWAKFSLDLPFNTQSLVNEEPYFTFELIEKSSSDDIRKRMINVQ